MNINENQIKRLTDALRLDTPIIALYDSEPSPDFDPMVEAKGRACCFAYYDRWMKGETLVVEANGGGFMDPKNGCPGMHNAFGLNKTGYPPWMANFLTDGKNGAPMGEGLKASPQIAQEFIDRASAPKPSGNHILMGPLQLSQWEKIRTLSFFVDPDRLSALMTLATYWTSDPNEIAAPFSSGCGLMWREMINFKRDRPMIGCTDIAMRKHLPPHILCLSVSPARFEKMVNYPDDAFLNKEWWNDLMKSRKNKK